MNKAIKHRRLHLARLRSDFARLRLAVRAAVYLALMPLLLRLFSLRAILEYFGRKPVNPPRSSHDLHDAVAVIARVCHLGMFRTRVFPRACLRQSMVLYCVLNRLGYPVRIHFGVRRGSARLEGHSWITLDGQLLAEPVLPDSYVNVYSYPLQPIECEGSHG
jgi:hypothetical protein